MLLLSSSKIWSSETIAEAVIVRGKVTVLELGELQAKVVKKGTKFKKDASILTGPRSFIRIKFKDQSLASLGPKSKMVVNQVGKRKTGLISLIKGKLRTKVIKKGTKLTKEKNSHTLFIKTTTASLGVRGTDFQVVYNSKNKVTSLLTYEGEVQISKNKVRKKSLKSKTEAEILEEQTKEMEKALNSKESVTVPRGQFSGVTPKLKKTTLPVKISPKQFTLLYKNDELKKPEELKGISKKDYIAQADQKAPLEGVSSQKTGDFAPRSGGFLDLETGLYVAPGKKSQLNKKLGVYEDKSIGSLSSKTGKYIPPKGLKLDAEKGFVPEVDLIDEKEIKKLKEKIKDLNEGIKKQKQVFSKKIGSIIKKIKFPKINKVKLPKIKKPKVVKDLLDPNLMPDKNGFLFSNSLGLRHESRKSNNNLGLVENKNTMAVPLSPSLTYGFTKNLSIGVSINLYFPLKSKLDYGPGAGQSLDGKTLDLEYEGDTGGPYFSFFYKHNVGYFNAVYKARNDHDLAAITDNDGKVLQSGSNALKEEYLSLNYKKTWKKKNDFYSLYLSFRHLGPKREIVEVPLLKDWKEGPKKFYAFGVEGQRNFNKKDAIRARLGIGKGPSFSYQNHLGQTGTIGKTLTLNQYFSYLHQSKRGLWSFFINRESFSGSIPPDQTDVNLTTFDMGLNYTKDFSFKNQ